MQSGHAAARSSLVADPGHRAPQRWHSGQTCSGSSGLPGNAGPLVAAPGDELDPAHRVHAAGDDRVVAPVGVGIGQRPQIPAHRPAPGCEPVTTVLPGGQPTATPASQLRFMATSTHPGQ
jgi:hypothetical protein